jgi:hypothetical protein
MCRVRYISDTCGQDRCAIHPQAATTYGSLNPGSEYIRSLVRQGTISKGAAQRLQWFDDFQRRGNVRFLKLLSSALVITPSDPPRRQAERLDGDFLVDKRDLGFEAENRRAVLSSRVAGHDRQGDRDHCQRRHRFKHETPRRQCLPIQ